MAESEVFCLVKILESLTLSAEPQVLWGNIEKKHVSLAQLFQSDFEIKKVSQ